MRFRRRFSLTFALALILSLVLISRPPPRRIQLGEPQVVETTKPQVCVHTLLENEVDEWKIQRSLQLTREMGAATIVQFFPWAYFEPNPGQFNWEQTDLIVRHARNQGLRIIARLGLVPQWARPDGQTTLNHLPEAAFDDFAIAAARLAEQYADSIQHFIVWNEPNLSFEWGYRPVDPAAYVRLLRATYQSIKSANPQATVLAGALAPTNERRGSAAGLSDLEYLRDMYRFGASAYFDALAVHSYGLVYPPESEPAPHQLNFRRLELLRQIMIENDDEHKAVYVTETGWNDHPRWSYAVRPSRRLAYTVRAFEYAEANWPWLNQLCIWALRYPAATLSYPDNFTLISPEFELKPIYFAIQNYARDWDESATRWLPPPQAN